MNRKITIADAHSRNNPKQTMTIELEGGSPWFGGVWINDVCYLITMDDRTKRVTVKRQK